MKETATDILLDDVAEGLFPRPCSNATCGEAGAPAPGVCYWACQAASAKI